jgi:hypothetical protein
MIKEPIAQGLLMNVLLLKTPVVAVGGLNLIMMDDASVYITLNVVCKY